MLLSVFNFFDMLPDVGIVEEIVESIEKIAVTVGLEMYTVTA